MSAVARRYAKALFALAKDAATLQPCAAELGRAATLASDPAVAPLLRNPLLTPEQRGELALGLARESASSDLLTRFMRLLADQQRLAELPAISQHFENLLDDELGRVRIAIRSAQPLEPAQQADLIAAFARLTGKEVIPGEVVDANLLGGVVVEVEGKVYDGSVRSQLERLERQLAGAASL
jgi:F-type H+-transporting ATPase subunit delta